MDSEVLADMLEALLAEREYYRLHQLTVVRNGEIVLDAAFYPFSRGLPHNVASIGKMITSTLIGIAIDEGYIASVDELVLGFFPDREISHRDARKEAITIAHLLAHRSGIDYQSDQYDEMMASPDWLQWILDLPMATDPGWDYSYSNANYHLAAWVLYETTGMTPLEFARRHLSGPLGIPGPIWEVDPQGVQWGFGGQFYLPTDLAKIGVVFLNQGVWRGRQVVSPEWVIEATSGYPGPHPPGWDPDWYAGFGWASNSVLKIWDTAGSGGQTMRMLVDDDLLVVTVAGGGLAYGACGLNGAVIDNLAYDYLRDAVVSSSPLASNPHGVARLAALVETASQPFDGPPQPVPPLPAIASTVSGVVYVMDANPAHVEWFSLSFPPGDEALVKYRTTDDVTARVGLDDVFRISPGLYGLPYAAKGRWLDATRFALILDQLAEWRLLDLEFEFDGDDVTITLQDLACGDPPVTLTGHPQQHKTGDVSAMSW
jgi:CubicO group peptidase (beta-lactamase class C family)